MTDSHAALEHEDPPRHVVLGCKPAVVDWLNRLDGDATLAHCADLGGAVRELREQIVDAIFVYLPELRHAPADAARALAETSPDVPIIGLVDSHRGSATDVLRAGFALLLAIDESPAAAAAALTEACQRFTRVSTAEHRTRSLTSRLRAVARRRDTLTRCVETLLHELRTPVAIVHGFASNLLDAVHGELDGDKRMIVERIKVASEHLRSLLDGHRIAAGETEEVVDDASAEFERPEEIRSQQRRQLYVRDVCKQVVELFEPLAREKDLQLEFYCKACPPIWGNRIRLTQLLINLLSNACRHTPPGGRVELWLAAAAVEGQRPAVRFSVADTGVGISERDQQRMFDDGFTTQQELGHQGMGLTITKQIIAEHGGSLEVDSELGRGTRFTIDLPLDPRTRHGQVRLEWLDDGALAGPLLVELQRAEGRALTLERRSDVDALCEELSAAGARVLLVGDLTAEIELLRVAAAEVR